MKKPKKVILHLTWGEFLEVAGAMDHWYAIVPKHKAVQSARKKINKKYQDKKWW